MRTGRKLDWPMYVCGRRHVAGTKSPYAFGGTYALDQDYDNRLTGGKSCPPGFKASLLGGSYGKGGRVGDHPIIFCWSENP